MTPAQRATLAAAIRADTNLTAALAAGDHGTIAAYYNAVPTVSPLSIYRPSISVSELNTAIVWSEFVALTALIQNGYMAIIASGTVDATSTNVRQGFATIFAGKTSLTNLTAIAQRPATRLEALLATSQVSQVFGQQVTAAEIIVALAGG